jgi:hypothetical protein
MAALTAACQQLAGTGADTPALISVGVVVTEGLQWVTGHLVVLVGNLLVGSSSTQLLNIVPAAGSNTSVDSTQSDKT